MIEDEKVGDEVLMIGAGQARRLKLAFHISCRSNIILQSFTLPMLGTLLSHTGAQ